jgi:hypothetical protein
MRAVLAGLMAFVMFLLVGPSTSDAASRNKHRPTYSRPYTPPALIPAEQKRRNARAYDRGEYYERDSNALPVGSKAWFEQKEREDGCC